MTKITAQETKINGQRRWHFVVHHPSVKNGKSLNTWASKRGALQAGQREWQWVK